ncbi:MAG TPA: efflux RND transporter periplasmic adaptor subunit [Tahibacter sp.]|jgi:multidrug efflux system membrane fusion protein|uniref:Efflux RND transporter periplasmic adaptor subunit n=1 Tax=Tahibacter soli TaxID=2983605 RepID=A0A9X3YMH4_9GAMM|nr:efflux RND transporter periplasmic adaptor subunit [Tahibacter soli]MDC8013985.1 efflux RND transporter periplasmic adaptor subunit [Tahibacter soli]HVJ62157.1 efflux RND transporter periplasmic adaptor subunit [Tahibacter sp.]
MHVGKLVPLVLTLAIATVLSGCGTSKADAPVAAAPAPDVTVAQVIAKPLHQFEEFTGQLQAVNTVDVRPRVSGVIDSVRFAEGTRVKKGDLLFQIDPRPFQAEVDRLQAELKRSSSRLSLAKNDHARAERLSAQNAIAREEFERRASVEAEASGEVGSVAAQLTAAKLNLEFTQVRSPIDGHVSRALITEGNLVTSASLLTSVVSDNPIYAHFDADEATFLKFRELAQNAGGAAVSPVYLGLISEQGYPHEGKLNFMDNRVDGRSGTIRARAVFDNADGRFTPGLFARIKLVGKESYDAILIDNKAVGTDLGKKYVFVLKADGTLDYRLVELGPNVDGLRVVSQGLTPEDVVVVNGLQHVRAGVKVNATKVAMDTGKQGLQQIAAEPAPRGTVAATTPAAR